MQVDRSAGTGEGQAAPSAVTSLEDKLNHLFATIRRPGGAKHTSAEVAAFVTEHTGEKCSREYLSQLRNGKKSNPTKRVLEGLAAFFDITPAYFFDDAKSTAIRAQLDLAVALREDTVRQAALLEVTTTLQQHVQNLSPDQLGVIADMIRSMSTRQPHDS